MKKTVSILLIGLCLITVGLAYTEEEMQFEDEVDYIFYIQT
jgi:hypothetical protein